MSSIVQSKYDRHFRTDHLMADLKGRSVRGGAVTLTAQAVKFVLQTGSTMVLARLLTPADFGLIAMVSAFTGFVGLFKDLGLSMATIQRPEITHAQVSTLFWINVALSALLALIAAALAPAVAWFYGEPQLTWITIAIAGTFIFGGLSAQHTALLRRQMRFKALASIEIASLAAGVAVAITLALLTRNYWALVAMTAAQAATTAAMSFAVSGWVPGKPQKRAGTRTMVAFGGNLTGASIFNFVRETSPLVVIGYLFGASPLAMYERAYRLLILPLKQMTPPIAAVAIPALCRVNTDKQRTQRAIRQLLRYGSAFSVPASAIGVLLAPEIIFVMLGEHWRSAATLLALLSPLAATQVISSIAIWVLTSSGQSHALMRFSVVNALIAFASIIAGTPFGIQGVALSFSAVGVLIRTPMLYHYVTRYTSITWSDLLSESLPFVIVGASFTSSALVVRFKFFDFDTPSALLALCIPLTLASCWVPLLLARRIPQELTLLRSTIRSRP